MEDVESKARDRGYRPSASGASLCSCAMDHGTTEHDTVEAKAITREARLRRRAYGAAGSVGGGSRTAEGFRGAEQRRDGARAGRPRRSTASRLTFGERSALAGA